MAKASLRHVELPRAVRALTRVEGPLVLAVSGGLDSMTLLHLVSRHRSIRRRCTVATFDHGTGAHAKRSARLVRARARSLGIPVVSGRAPRVGANEGEWREMRWAFLRSAAARRGATIVTAHTRDDQIETVVMRVLRGARARGMAALYADSPIVRPFVHTSRRTLARFAADRNLTYVDDPTNDERRFLRNRVRHDLLPAIRAVRPTFEREILALARRAARLRCASERLVRRLLEAQKLSQGSDRVLLSPTSLSGLGAAEWAYLWPVFAARLGVALDRRGIVRATSFSLTATTGQRVQCSGGVTLERTKLGLCLALSSIDGPPATVPLARGVQFGGWRLRLVSRAAFRTHTAVTTGVWGAAIEGTQNCEVRAWQPGDRVRAGGASQSRRITRYFSEIGVPASERRSWPVVVSNGEVVWVPGVCRSNAAGERAGRPMTYVVCERRDR